MTLRLNGSTSGYTEIDAPAVAGSNTLVLPASNGSAGQLLKNGSTAGSLEFSSSVSIDSSNRLLVGTSSGDTKLYVYDATTPQATFNNGTSSFIVGNSSGGNNHILYGTGAYPMIFYTDSTERMRIKADGNINLSSAVYNNTTVNAANMFINTSPDYGIFRSTSSIKYKTSVETIEDSYSDAILNCRPVWYRSLCGGDNKDYGYWGFIAEEVAAIDPRLCFFKEEEDGTLEAEGVQYDRFVPHLLNLIKRQQQAIETLEARLAALEVTP